MPVNKFGEDCTQEEFERALEWERCVNIERAAWLASLEVASEPANGSIVKSSGSWGGVRAGAGRPKAESSIGGKTVSAYLGPDDLEYLAKWGASNTDAIRRLIHRARLMWPKGE